MNLKERILGGGVKGADSRDSSYQGSIQAWIPVKNILKGMVCTKDGRFVKVLEVLPVNFYMRSELERKNIIHYFTDRLREEAETARRYLDMCGLEVLEPRL